MVDMQTIFVFCPCIQETKPDDRAMTLLRSTSFRGPFALWRLIPLPAIALSGCTRAPLQDVLGSFFPSWMLCATLGAVAAAFLRAVLGVFNLQQAVPAPMLTYLAFMVTITFVVWLIFFGH